MSPAEEMRTAAERMRRYNTKFWRELAAWLEREARFTTDGAAGDPAALMAARAYLEGE